MVIGMLNIMRLVLFALFTIMASCSTSKGPDVILLDSSTYNFAFTTALQVAKTQGLQPVLLNRRSGTISTDPAIAGSIVEPWKPRASSPIQALENTLSYQRRTARFEFTAVHDTMNPSLENEELRGPDLLAPTETDLTQYVGPMELRVWVYVDRNYREGVRRNTTSLLSESVSITLPSEEPWEQVPGNFWAPVSRDVGQERALLGEIETLIQSQ